MKKGATPIIAVILLLLITIAAGGATYLWLSRTQSTLFAQTSEGITASSKQIYGRIDIVSVWNETNQLCLLLRNLSEQEITYTDEDLENDLGLDPEALRGFYTAIYEAFVGGDRMVRFSTELRFPIYRALRGVTFLDTGITWLDEVGVDIDDMREGAGLGLRLTTPIGFIRLDYAWKLDRRPGESGGRWHIALGSAF